MWDKDWSHQALSMSSTPLRGAFTWSAEETGDRRSSAAMGGLARNKEAHCAQHRRKTRNVGCVSGRRIQAPTAPNQGFRPLRPCFGAFSRPDSAEVADGVCLRAYTRDLFTRRGAGPGR